MPTYSYYCQNCDKHFSYFQKMTEEPFTICEDCKGKIKRLITGGTGLIFKGTGFYLTDYKNNNKTKTQNSDSGQKGSKKLKSDSKSIKSKETDQSSKKKEK